jgi:Flp pilus assembly protein TadG
MPAYPPFASERDLVRLAREPDGRPKKANKVCKHRRLLAAAGRLTRHFLYDEHGGYLVVTALMSPILIGVVGLAADYGMWVQTHRAMQNAADSAAVSAATAYAVGTTNSDTQAKAIASSYGFVHGTNSVTVTVNRPPTSGSYLGNSAAVEVIISAPRTPVFSYIYNSSSGTILARTVALASGSGSGCVLALDTTASGALTDDGTTDVKLNNCSLYDNSSSSSALTMNGSATLTAKSVNVVGNISGKNQITTTGGIWTGVAPAADPYASIANPAATGSTVNTCCNDGTYSPGIYKGGMKLTGKANVTLSPGTYYLQGDLEISGGSTLTGTGVTLVFTSSNGSTYAGAAINGGANISLTAPTSGTYAGIAMFGDRNMTLGKTFSFNGGTTQNIIGAIYLPKGYAKYAGGSTNADSNKCTQLIADTIEFTGNAQFNINCSGVGVSQISSMQAKIVE